MNSENIARREYRLSALFNGDGHANAAILRLRYFDAAAAGFITIQAATLSPRQPRCYALLRRR